MRVRASTLAAILITCLLPLLADAAPASSVEEALAAAQKAGRPVFLLVTEPGAIGVDELRGAAQAAVRTAPHVDFVELDRTAEVHRAVVKRYGLVSARLPMVLVLAHNGAPAGGAVPGKKVAERLLSLLPSPRKAETLLALFEGKAAFLVVGRAAMTDRAAALAAARQAVLALDGKAAIVGIDLDDEHEAVFLELLGAKREATAAAVHVYGLSGQKTGVVAGEITSAALVEAAKKKAACCPGGKCG